MFKQQSYSQVNVQGCREMGWAAGEFFSAPCPPPPCGHWSVPPPLWLPTHGGGGKLGWAAEFAVILSPATPGLMPIPFIYWLPDPQSCNKRNSLPQQGGKVPFAPGQEKMPPPPCTRSHLSCFYPSVSPLFLPTSINVLFQILSFGFLSAACGAWLHVYFSLCWPSPWLKSACIM